MPDVTNVLWFTIAIYHSKQSCVTVQCAVMCHGKVAVSLLCVNNFLLLTALTDPSYIIAQSTVQSHVSLLILSNHVTFSFSGLRLTTAYFILQCVTGSFTLSCVIAHYRTVGITAHFSQSSTVSLHVFCTSLYVHMQFLHSIICFLNI